MKLPKETKQLVIDAIMSLTEQEALALLVILKRIAEESDKVK